MDAIIIYWSKTGNTEKVAWAIQEGLKDAATNVSLRRVENAGDIDFYDYDLVCIGFPSYQWSPPKPMDTFIQIFIYSINANQFMSVDGLADVAEYTSRKIINMIEG
jgi:flavodoxin